MPSFRAMVALGALSVFTASPCSAEMCQRFPLHGRVKRFVLTEQTLDPAVAGVLNESKETHRITVSKDGSIVEEVVLEGTWAKQRFISTVYYDANGRMVRVTRTRGGKVS